MPTPSPACHDWQHYNFSADPHPGICGHIITNVSHDSCAICGDECMAYRCPECKAWITEDVKKYEARIAEWQKANSH